MILDYSVIIRTTGKAGEKYRKLLSSISGLELPPREVIVVLPEGYKPPDDTIGIERMYFCPKGMVIQRLYGISQCKSRYALICDDDIAFEPDFVEKLAKPVINGEYGFSAGPLLNFFPNPGIQTVISALIGACMPTVFHKERYNTILKTTGYSFNRNIKVGDSQLYETQSAPWTCFFADMDALKKIHFEDESWLDKCGYSAHDDTAMFYKAWLCGQKAVIVANAEYEHLDAKTSKRGNREKVEYATSFNTVVFWHRFIYSQSSGIGKIWCKVCLNYRILMQGAFNHLKHLRGKMTKAEQRAYYSGINDGKKWIITEEYRQLPPVRY